MKKVLSLFLLLAMVFSVVPTLGASASELEPVTLKFIFYGDKKAATDEVWAAIADKYRDVLNCDFDVQFIPGEDYRQKLFVMAAAGEPWDMNFDGDWLGYYQMIAMDAYADLKDLMPQYAPDLYAAYQESGALQVATYQDKVVSLPWTMVMNYRTNFQWRGDLAKAAGIEIDKDAIHTVEDVYEVLKLLQAAYPDRYIIESASLEAARTKYNLVHIGNDLVVDLTDPTHTVVPQERTAAYMEYAKLAEKLQNEGLIWKDILNDSVEKNALIDQGKLITKWGTYETARSNRAWVEEGAYWDYAFLYEEGLSPHRTPLANVACISATSKNPERVLMFMNLLQTDRELYDMVHYGILGKTYELNGEEAVYPEGMNIGNSNYMDWQGRWAYWKPQFMRPDATFAKDFWKQEEEYAYSNPNNVVSPFDGFSFNAEDVSIEIAQREQVRADAKRLIEVGLAGDAETAVNKLIEDQRYNADIIVAEAQRQVDAYFAAKGE